MPPGILYFGAVMLKGDTGQRYVLVFCTSIFDLFKDEFSLRITGYTKSNFLYDVVCEKDPKFDTLLPLVANIKLRHVSKWEVLDLLKDRWRSQQDLTSSKFCPMVCLSPEGKGTAVGEIVNNLQYPTFQIRFSHEPQ